MARAIIHLDIISENYRKLVEKAGANPLLPVVKTDAYGMGLLPVVRTLWDCGCRSFCAGSVDEACSIRHELPDAEIIAMFGARGEQEWHRAREERIIPLVHDGQGLLDAPRYGVRDIALKLEGGMKRTGFLDVPGLDGMPLNVRYIMTHLPCADDPSKKAETEAQISAFMEKANELLCWYPQAKLSIGASAGLMPHNSMPPGTVIRSGIALYADYGGLGTKDALAISVPVLALNAVARGEAVSYGGLWWAAGHSIIAAVQIGYADGLPRSASGKVSFVLEGHIVPQIGAVCMNVSMIDISSIQGVAYSKLTDEDCWLLGDGQTIADLSGMTGQTAYEILCLYGRLNAREYRGLSG